MIPDPTQVAQALEKFLRREPEIAFDLHDDVRLILDAARTWTAWTTTCPTCEGTLVDGSTYVPATHLEPSSAEMCRECVSGVIPKPEAIEAMARQMTDAVGLGVEWEYYLRWVEAGLMGLLAWIEGNSE